MRERRGVLLEGAVRRYLAVGTFQWKEMRWKEKKEKFFPKRSHQWKRIMYFKVKLDRKSRYIKYPLVKISTDILV